MSENKGRVPSIAETEKADRTLKMFHDEKSSWMAGFTLERIIDVLENGGSLPFDAKDVFITALKRTLKEGNAVNFLYGPRHRAGSPGRDIFGKIPLYSTVEIHHKITGRYNDSRAGVGAYSSVKDLLETFGVFMSQAAIAKVHKEVKRRMKSDEAFAEVVTDLIERHKRITLGK